VEQELAMVLLTDSQELLIQGAVVEVLAARTVVAELLQVAQGALV
jgi:hypothetical protein